MFDARLMRLIKPVIHSFIHSVKTLELVCQNRKTETVNREPKTAVLILFDIANKNCSFGADFDNTSFLAVFPAFLCTTDYFHYLA